MGKQVLGGAESRAEQRIMGTHKGRTSKTSLGKNFKEEIFKCGSQKRLQIARGYLRSIKKYVKSYLLVPQSIQKEREMSQSKIIKMLKYWFGQISLKRSFYKYNYLIRQTEEVL